MHPAVAKTRDFVSEVIAEWQKDDALTLGAALAYYTIFSIAPLLVLAVAIAGLVFGRRAAEGQLVAQIQDAIGPSAAQMIEGMIARASKPASGVVATVVSLLTMGFGASGMFGQLQSSLNKIWEVHGKTAGGFRGQVRRRTRAALMILGTGLLLLVSLGASAALGLLHEVLKERFPVASVVLPFANTTLEFTVITGLFAMIYKMLPEIRIEWRDVWLGAVVTAFLFALGRELIGLYLGRAGVTSVYGAAGSLVLLLLWIYYSAQLLFLGAEFTEVYSRRFGSRRTEQA
ncbi:MAG TPA: YihY/virulence factor BrkB family protein [Myxococcota bacterium]|nr:YihY/virulence factor BrkB family protein [Myxococcota bacterium]